MPGNPLHRLNGVIDRMTGGTYHVVDSTEPRAGEDGNARAGIADTGRNAVESRQLAIVLRERDVEQDEESIAKAVAYAGFGGTVPQY